MRRRGHALRRRYGRAFVDTHDVLRTKLRARARRMSFRDFSDSLTPEEYRAITFFGGHTGPFYEEATR